MPSPTTAKLAPFVAAALLAALLGWNTIERETGGNVDAYMAEVKEQIESTPYWIGPYLGVKGEVAQSAIELLRPNEILQRRYVEPETGQSFWLLIVHCGEANDMYGHYPPRCYTGAGWVMERVGDAEAEDVVVQAGGIDIPAKRYRLRLRSGIETLRRDILSFFIVPSGTSRFGGDMRLVDMASRSPATAKLGAAQVQILTDAGMPEETRREIWRMVLEEITPTLVTMSEGTS